MGDIFDMLLPQSRPKRDIFDALSFDDLIPNQEPPADNPDPVTPADLLRLHQAMAAESNPPGFGQLPISGENWIGGGYAGYDPIRQQPIFNPLGYGVFDRPGTADD